MDPIIAEENNEIEMVREDNNINDVEIIGESEEPHPPADESIIGDRSEIQPIPPSDSFNIVASSSKISNLSLIEIRKGKLCTREHKETLALAAVEASCTVNQIRKAYKRILKGTLGIDVFLTVEEALKHDPDLIGLEPPRKIPRTLEDYKLYRNVIASDNTISRTMHDLAILQERNAALALLEKGENVKTTVHYDTTSRRNAFGEQTSMIVEFSDGQEFTLRPLPLARENKESIVQFFLEELERLSIAAMTEKRTIWESLDAFMTDSASKNMGIAAEIAMRLGNSTL